MTQKIQGVEGLSAKLRELASPKEQAAALRASVRVPMKGVMKRAQANIVRISPGLRALHRTYKGRLVSAGFAARSIRMAVRLSPDKTSAYSVLGVLAEAFYALQFLELGTAYIARQPWLTPAFYSSKDESIRGVGIELKKRIDRIAAKRDAGK